MMSWERMRDVDAFVHLSVLQLSVFVDGLSGSVAVGLDEDLRRPPVVSPSATVQGPESAEAVVARVWSVVGLALRGVRTTYESFCGPGCRHSTANSASKVRFLSWVSKTNERKTRVNRSMAATCTRCRTGHGSSRKSYKMTAFSMCRNANPSNVETFRPTTIGGAKARLAVRNICHLAHLEVFLPRQARHPETLMYS